MRKLMGAAVAVALSIGTVAVTTGDATAASSSYGSVTIKKIPTKKVNHGKSAKISPRVQAHGNVRYSSRKLTVTKGKKTVAKNKTSVRLKAGKYRVKTTVKYRVWRYATRYVKTVDHAYSAGEQVPVSCTITSVVDPDSTTTTSFTQSCTGQFDGALSRTGQATWDEVLQEWILADGTRVPRASLQGYQQQAQTVVAPRALTRTVSTPEEYRKYGSLRVKVRTQSLTIKQRPRPRSTSPDGWDCPSWAPIKGNASSMIYHMPDGAYYDRTDPEICFTTESAAKDAGYRRSQR